MQDILYPFIAQPSYAQVFNLNRLPSSAPLSFQLPAQRPSRDQQIMTKQMSLYGQCNRSLALVLDQTQYAASEAAACGRLTKLLFPDGRIVSSGAPSLSLGGHDIVQRQEAAVCSNSCLKRLRDLLSEAATECSAAWNACPQDHFSSVSSSWETAATGAESAADVNPDWREPTLTGRRILEKLLVAADLLYALDTTCSKDEFGRGCTVGLMDLVSSPRQRQEAGTRIKRATDAATDAGTRIKRATDLRRIHGNVSGHSTFTQGNISGNVCQDLDTHISHFGCCLEQQVAICTPRGLR